MSQPDPARPTPTWTGGSIALLIIGALLMVLSGLCTATFGFRALFSPYAILVLIFGGIPFLIGAALVDVARYYHHASSGWFGKVVLLVAGVLMGIHGLLMIYPELGGAQLYVWAVFLVETAIGIALLVIALNIKPRKRAR